MPPMPTANHLPTQNQIGIVLGTKLVDQLGMQCILPIYIGIRNVVYIKLWHVSFQIYSFRTTIVYQIVKTFIPLKIHLATK